MRTALLVAFFLSALPASASAQASRTAHVLSLAAETPAVVVARDRVFTPADPTGVLSACAGNRCAPVRSSEICNVPRCPGAGYVLALESPISDASDFPTDRDGFNHAMDVLRQDPALAAIAWSFGAHPDPGYGGGGSSLSFIGPSHWLWELGAYGIGGVVGSNGVGFAGGELSVGFRYVWSPRGDDEMLALFFGDSVGIDLRTRVVDFMPVQGGETWGLTVGLAPAMAYASRDAIFRIPTLYSCLVPEAGLALRQNGDAAAYIGWSLPVAFLITRELGIEARASVLLIDDWLPGDDVEALVSFGLGLIGR